LSEISLKFKKITEQLLLFMSASFIGWLYEIITVYIMYHTYYDRGVLHLPVCPVYGFGMLLFSFALKNVKNPALFFLGSAAISTVLELLVSYVAQYGFGWILWSYNDWPLNFQGRISLISSCIFGLLAVVFVKFLKPLICKLFENRRSRYTCSITWLVAVICFIREMLLIPG